MMASLTDLTAPRRLTESPVSWDSGFRTLVVSPEEPARRDAFRLRLAS